VATDNEPSCRPGRARRLRSLDTGERAGPGQARTFDLVPHAATSKFRRTLAVGCAVAAAAVGTLVVTGYLRDDPPALVTVPAGPPSMRIRAEQAVFALQQALDREEPAAIEAAASELRDQLAQLPEPDREAVAVAATTLLDEADRALDGLPPTAPSTTTPPSSASPATPASPSTTTPGTFAPSTTVPPPSTTTTVDETTTTTTPTSSTTTTTLPAGPTSESG